MVNSQEIKRCLLVGRKAMTNQDSILKSRDITLPTMVHLIKATVFPIFMYRCENWTVKKAERRRIDAFELWCWKTFLRVPWTARRSTQSILKEINPGVSLEAMMLKLKLQYFGHLMRRRGLIGKDFDAGRDWGQEEKGTTEDEMAGWHHWLDGRESESTPGVGDGQGGLECCDSWGRKESDTTEQLNWTELKITADGDCSHEIKRRLLLGRKVMSNLDGILKSRDINYFANKGPSSQGYGFPSGHVWMWVGLWRKLSTELVLLNCAVGKDSWESLGLQGDPTRPFWRRSALGFLWKQWC